MKNSSSSAVTKVPSSSTKTTPEENAYLNPFIMQPKPPSTAQIRAKGEVDTKIAIIRFVGITCTLLIIIGGITLIRNPEHAKDTWVIIGPIISSAITGTVAFLAGEKQGSRN